MFHKIFIRTEIYIYAFTDIGDLLYVGNNIRQKTHVYFNNDPYTPVLRKEVEWDSEKNAWLIAGTLVSRS